MYIKTKTISCHYDPIYCLEHNNRDIISANVDISRTPNNYNCVVAGGAVLLEYELPLYWPDIQKEYRRLMELYWERSAIVKAKAEEEYWNHIRTLNRIRQAREDAMGGVEVMVKLLFFPLSVYVYICKEIKNWEEEKKLEEELHKKEVELFIANAMVHSRENSIRLGLWTYDREYATHYLERVDEAVKRMEAYIENIDFAELDSTSEEIMQPRFATIEEIYDHIFEPSFREFQDRQRPCRRYEGTYLEQIREGQVRERRKKQQNKNAKCRAPAEAIEFVVGIGDMDNTGYLGSPEDAYKSEILLKDYCDYLLTKASNVCVVTTKELEDPNWQPPFKNGLIILNMTMHADEATPGIHLTCIPYSRGCKRGPAVQASLGRAMAGMGYPSTWKDVLDENGERIPKRNKNGDIIRNKDGSIRYQQEPDKQGVIDWIEDQKAWLQTEMQRRYGWSREYKGSHSRGNLSIPDYKVARAKERQAEIEKQVEDVVYNATARIEKLLQMLNSSAEYVCRNDDNGTFLVHYINSCSNEEYERIIQQAEEYMKNISSNERVKVHQALNEIVPNANMKQKEQLLPNNDNKQRTR